MKGLDRRGFLKVAGSTAAALAAMAMPAVAKPQALLPEKVSEAEITYHGIDLAKGEATTALQVWADGKLVYAHDTDFYGLDAKVDLFRRGWQLHMRTGGKEVPLKDEIVFGEGVALFTREDGRKVVLQHERGDAQKMLHAASRVLDRDGNVIKDRHGAKNRSFARSYGSDHGRHA